MLNLEFKNTDTGFARIYYTENNGRKKPFLYCFQESFRGVFALYRCSLDGEPSHEVSLSNIETIEHPDESALKKAFMAWGHDNNLNFQPTEELLK